MKIEGFDLNDRVERSAALALASGRFPHAVVVEGGSASERLAFAEKAAAALLRRSESGTPRAARENRKKSVLGGCPDALLYSVEDKPRAFKIELVREIRSKAYSFPSEADVKVFILENAHAMGTESQNALLKILEEPPEYVRFILLCASKSSFLPTILSRSVVYSLGRGDSADDSDVRLREAALNAARETAAAAIAPEEFEIVKAAGAFEKNPELTRAALPIMREIFAEALRVKYSAGEDGSAFGEVPQKLARRLGRRSLLALSERCGELSEAIRLNANHNLTVTAICVKLRAAANVENRR